MAKPDEIQPGEIQFYDNYQPVLTAGEYTVNLTQTIDLGESEEEQTFRDQRTFLVEGQRWRLGPADVHAVYPPPGSSGNYAGVLPHIVLRRRELPWERTVGTTTVEIESGIDKFYPRPWLALLLFTADELGDARPTTRPINGLSAAVNGPTDPANATIHLPDITLDTGEEAQIGNADAPPVTQTIDVPRRLFASIAPQLDELPFLAHVREVDTGGKEILGMEADGWFSVVVANRLPNSATDSSVPHVAHLVSLQGWEDELQRRQVPANDRSMVRLVTLASWSFTTLADGRGDFAALLRDLDGAVVRAGDADGGPALLKPPPFTRRNTAAERRVGDALAKGYVPLNFRNRVGEASAAWYRGPLTPQKVVRQQRDPYRTAAEALVYDEQTHLFDVSYSVAWQLGRLLALSDENFAGALTDWRQRGQHLHDLFADRQQLQQIYGQVMDTSVTQDDVNAALLEAVALLEPRQVSRMISRFLIHDIVDLTRSDADIGSPYWDAFQSELPGLTDEKLREMLALPPDERATWFNQNLADLLTAPEGT